MKVTLCLSLFVIFFPIRYLKSEKISEKVRLCSEECSGGHCDGKGALDHTESLTLTFKKKI